MFSRRPLLLSALVLAGCASLARQGTLPTYRVEPLVAVGDELADLAGGQVLELGEVFELGPGEIAFWARVRARGENAWALLTYGQGGLRTIAEEGEATAPPHAADGELRVHLHRLSGAHPGARVHAGGGVLALSTPAGPGRPASVLAWDGDLLRQLATAGDVLSMADGPRRIDVATALDVGADGRVLVLLQTRPQRDVLAAYTAEAAVPLLWSGARLPGLDRPLVEVGLPPVSDERTVRAFTRDGGLVAQVFLQARPAPLQRPPRPRRPGEAPPPEPSAQIGRRPGPPLMPGWEPASIVVRPGATSRLLAVDDLDPLDGEGAISSVSLVVAASAETYVTHLWRDEDGATDPGVTVLCHQGICRPILPPTLAADAALALAGRDVQLGIGAPATRLGPRLEVKVLSNARFPGAFVGAGPAYVYPVLLEIHDLDAGLTALHHDLVLFDGERSRFLPIEPFVDPRLSYRSLTGPRPGLLIRGLAGGVPGLPGQPPRELPLEVGRWFLDAARLDAGLEADPPLPTAEGSPPLRLGDVVSWRGDGSGLAVTKAGIFAVNPRR